MIVSGNLSEQAVTLPNPEGKMQELDTQLERREDHVGHFTPAFSGPRYAAT